MTLSDDELRIEVEACPAVTHMRKQGYPVARLFHDTTRTVNEAICHGCGVCACVCPRQTIQLSYYEDDQIMSKIDALLAEGM